MPTGNKGVPKKKRVRATKPKEPLSKLRGRPPEYDPAYHCEHATRYCLGGATNEKLAEWFGVAEGTIDKWAEVHPEFNRALAEGRHVADATVAIKGLFIPATGYSHEDEKIFVVKDDTAEGVKLGGWRIIRVPYTKHYPPSAFAAHKWLEGRYRRVWGPQRAVSLLEEMNAAAALVTDNSPNAPKSVTITIKGGLPIDGIIEGGTKADDGDGADLDKAEDGEREPDDAAG